MVWYFNEHCCCCCCCSSGLCTRKFFYPSIAYYCCVVVVAFFALAQLVDKWQLPYHFFILLLFFWRYFHKFGRKKIKTFCTTMAMAMSTTYALIAGCWVVVSAVQCSRWRKKLWMNPVVVFYYSCPFFWTCQHSHTLMSDWRPIDHCIGVKQKEIVHETIEFNAAV